MINYVVIIKLMQVLHRIQLKPASDIVHYSAKFEQYHNASIKWNKQGLSRNTPCQVVGWSVASR